MKQLASAIRDVTRRYRSHSLPAEADSTLSNNSSNTLLAESAASSAVSPSGVPGGASSPATYTANEEIVGWLNNMFADTSRPTSFLVSLSTVIAIIESRPSSGNGASRLIAEGDIRSSRPKMACNLVCSSLSRSSVDSVDQSGAATPGASASSAVARCSVLGTPTAASNSETTLPK